MHLYEESEIFKQVLIRALWDSLGFTGESKPSLHARLVREAREWFYNAENTESFEQVCLYAGYDARKVRRSAQNLIEARQSGDHTKIPDFWREAFRKGRMPSFSAYASEIDSENASD